MNLNRRLITRSLAAILTLVILGVVALFERPQSAVAQYIGPGGAFALSSGPKEVHGFVHAVDGDTLDMWLEGQRVAVGLSGVWTPMGNTDCGKEATKHLQSLIRSGIRLQDDAALTVDGRLRRIFKASTLDGRSIATDMVENGFARADERTDEHDSVLRLEAEAQADHRGCVWADDDPPANLRGARPSQVEKPYDFPAGSPKGLLAPQLVGETLLTFFSIGDDVFHPSLAFAQAATATANVQLPANFVQDTVINSGLSEPTNLAFLPDGRLLVAQKNGVVRLFKNGQLQPTPFIDISDRVNTYYDHGLIGMAVDPNFASNNYIYLLYTYEDNAANFSSGKTGRLARYAASGDTASPSTEFVVVGHYVGSSCENFPMGYDCLPSDNLSHSVGNVQFASDGSMYLTSGDGASFSVVDPLALRAQNLDSLGGKLLHITSTGQGFNTNPFFNGDVTANRSKVWTYGLRNPFRFALKPGTNMPYIGNVGWNTYEEVDLGKRGANQGWPCYEGPFIQSGYQAYSQCQALYPSTGPGRTADLLYYPHIGGSSAIAGGFFYTGTGFPTQYQGAFFVGDYGQGWLNTVQTDANDNLVPSTITQPYMGNTFKVGGMTGANDGPVFSTEGPDGAVYWINIVGGMVNRIRYISPTSPPTVAGSATPTNGLLPLTVTFSSAGTSDPNGRPLTYDWDFGDGTAHSSAANPSHAYTTKGSFTAKLTVTNNVPASNTWTTTIIAGSNPPTATISSPSSSLLYKIGDAIAYSGTATDYDGTPIPSSGLLWQIIIHHCPQGSCHTHFLQTATGPTGSFIVPDHGDDTYLELQLTATNSAGLTATSSVSIHPQTATLSFNSTPVGMTVVYDGTTGQTPGRR